MGDLCVHSVLDKGVRSAGLLRYGRLSCLQDLFLLLGKGLIMMIDTGDTAWVLISAALVFIMTPGLAFFYGGMVRSKNVLTTIMQSFFVLALISVEFILIGYTMAFGPDVNGFIGNLDKIGLTGIGLKVLEGSTIPELAFVAFQCMFAALTPALITGAFAERMKFAAFMTICLLLGKRHGYQHTAMLPHNLPMTVLGATLLWFGWFGFNAGSALGANALAANAFITSQAAAAAAAVSWVLVEWKFNGKPTILGAVSGCVAGLVAITPAAGFVTPMPAVLIGLIGGVICYFAVAVLKEKLGYDDSLDAFGVHGIGGTWGAIATGLWATTEVNPAGANGLFYGDTHLFTAQLISIVVAYALAIGGSFVLYQLVHSFMETRADEAEELTGLDIIEHGERGYTRGVLTSSPLLGSFETSSEMLANTVMQMNMAEKG